jgi:hypothetical protein
MYIPCVCAHVVFGTRGPFKKIIFGLKSLIDSGESELRFNEFSLVTFNFIRAEILKFKFLRNVRFSVFWVNLASIQRTALPFLQGRAACRKVWVVASQTTRIFEA